MKSVDPVKSSSLKGYLPHVPGIVTHVSAYASICMHGYEGHNLWHYFYQLFDPQAIFKTNLYIVCCVLELASKLNDFEAVLTTFELSVVLR